MTTDPEPNSIDAEEEADDERTQPSGAELLIEYLQTEQGHAIADRLVTLFKKKQHQTIEKAYSLQARILVAQIVVFVVTLGVLTFLSNVAKSIPRSLFLLAR